MWNHFQITIISNEPNLISIIAYYFFINIYDNRKKLSHQLESASNLLATGAQQIYNLTKKKKP
jgi:hypothetical protein